MRAFFERSLEEHAVEDVVLNVLSSFCNCTCYSAVSSASQIPAAAIGFDLRPSSSSSRAVSRDAGAES